MAKEFLKIWFSDIETAHEFFDGNDKHLGEFMVNVYRSYAELPLNFQCKLVAKYFKTYSKQIEFIKKAKADGSKAHLQNTENQQHKGQTLEGVVQGGVLPPLPPTLEAKDKRINDKGEMINDKGEIIKEEEEEVAVQNCTSTVPLTHLNSSSDVTHTNLDNPVGYSKTQETQAVIFPFDTENFKSAWKNWLQYRSEKRKPLKGILEQQSALKKLSQFDEEFAISLIETSMGNGWTGLVFDKTKEQYELYKNSRTKIGKTIDEIIRMRYQ